MMLLSSIKKCWQNNISSINNFREIFITEAILIDLINGAVGGNAAGALLKKLSLGTVGNSIVGILGGGIGGQLLSMLGGGGLDGIVGSLASGGLGGGALMMVVGLVKK